MAKRRIAAAVGLAIYVVGAFIAPLTHIVSEHWYTTLQERAERVVPSQVIDQRTGNVDLDRLAQALGLDGAHDESKPHSHTPGEPPHEHGPLDHGAGSIQHFGVALLAAGAVAFVPVQPVPPAAEFIAAEPATRPPTQRPFLAVQRAQAPPV